MTIHPAAFYVVAVLVVASAVVVVASRNLVHAAFALVGCLFAVGVLYLALGADFLAGAQILIYAGAIPVLLIFGIMLTRDSMSPQANRLGPWWPAALLAAAGMTAVLLATVLVSGDDWRRGRYPQELLDRGTSRVIGQQLLTRHALPFEVASVLLLAALVGAIVLARRDADEMALERAEEERRQREQRARRRREARLRARRPPAVIGEDKEG